MSHAPLVRATRSGIGRVARLVCCAWLIAWCGRAAGAEAFPRWHEVECTLTSANPVRDPYHADPVVVRFTGPDRASVRVVAFSDDGVTYRARTALGLAGDWRWQLEAAPAGASFATRAGAVHIANPAEDNLLYRHGFLRVSDDGHYLAYDDGTPFFWLGDTAWNGLWRSTADEWEAYLRHRRAQGFSVVLAHATHSKSVSETVNRDGLPPFKDGKPVAAYWDSLDAKVRRANELGMVVLVVGVGYSSSTMFREETTQPAFARYLAARFSGRFVIFSPSMDTRFAAANDVMGRALAATAPRQLRTQHVGTDLPAALAYAAADYMSFAAIQSGHANGNVARTRANVREWLPAVQARAGARPTLNLEAMYDRTGPAESPAWRRIDARQLGYLSWVYGSPGYTYGTPGVWQWVPAGTAGSREEAMEWESAHDMIRLRDFFAALPWWELRPAPGALLDESPVTGLAASRDRSLVVGYLSEGDGLSISRAFVSERSTGSWFDPLSGKRSPITAPVAAGDQHWRFVAPTRGEWVLTLQTDPAKSALPRN